MAPARASLLLSYLAFVSLALPDGLLGVGWPSMSKDFEVPLDSAAAILVAGTTGYTISSLAAGFGVARLGVGRLLAGSTALVAVGLVGYATAPLLVVLVPLAVLIGLGSGAIDTGLNAYAAASFSAKHMNWMHAFFGAGMAIGPLVMTAVLAADLSWRWGYVVIAVVQVVLTTVFVVTSRRWAPHRPIETEDVERPRVSARETLRLPAVWLGGLAFAVYVAVEISVGLWAFVLLTEGRGLEPTLAGLCVSGYWACLFLGRIVLGAASERFGSRAVLNGALLGLVTGSVVLALPAPPFVAVIALAILGTAAAPVFPLLTHETEERVGADHADGAVGIQIAAAGLGGVALPGLTGVLMSRVDANALGLVAGTLSLVLVAIHLTLTRTTPAPAPARR